MSNIFKPGLTFEEFIWAWAWMAIAVIPSMYGDAYKLKRVRELVRRAGKNELWTGPYGDKSEWAGIMRAQYKHYQKEQSSTIKP